jgi:lipopolysaccharide/colanic/teichoic acid biosynthesis glycosyltransferase
MAEWSRNDTNSISDPQPARTFLQTQGADVRSVKYHQVDFMESTPRKILFVGKNGSDFAENIRDLNYEGIYFATAQEVLEWVNHLNERTHQDMPNAIICEVELPDADAYTLYEQLKNNEHLQHIPFIVVGDDDDNKHKIKAFQTGVDDFYTFPLSFVDMHKRIVFLQQFKAQKAKHNHVDETFYMEKIPLSKRVFDIAVSFFALLILSPLLITIVLLIKFTSKGAVFYTSKRVGTGYKIFDFYKFRSMRVGADAELAKLLHLNQYSDGKFVKIANDPRITPLGHFIRNTSIDELPQLFNVLKGDMSIVGNRPLPLYEAEQLTVDRWSKRFLAPAGITGLWQVTKRGKKEMSEEERMELDIIYAKKYSLWFDLMIILKTFPALFQKEKV